MNIRHLRHKIKSKKLIMKTIILILLTTSMMMLGSCSKDKPSKPQEHFIKTIQCTYPETYTNRHSTFTYDDNNRIKEFKFYMTGQTVSATFSYNQDDLITQIDELWTNLTTGNETLRLIEFRYAGSTLNEYISDGTSYLVTYEPVTNSYKVLDNIFSLNAHKNLMKMDRDECFRVTNKLTIIYIRQRRFSRRTLADRVLYSCRTIIYLLPVGCICV